MAKNKNKNITFKNRMMSNFNHKKGNVKSPDLTIMPPKKKKVPNLLNIISDPILQEPTPKTNNKTTDQTYNKKDGGRYLNTLHSTLNHLKEKINGIITAGPNTTINKYYSTNKAYSTKNKHIHIQRNNNTKEVQILPKIIKIPQKTLINTHTTENEKINTVEKQAKNIVNNYNSTFLPQHQTKQLPTPMTEKTVPQKTNVELSSDKRNKNIPQKTNVKLSSDRINNQSSKSSNPHTQQKTKTPVYQKITNIKEIYNTTKSAIINSILKNNKLVKTFASTKIPPKTTLTTNNTNDNYQTYNPIVNKIANISNRTINEMKNIVHVGKKIKIPSLAKGGIASRPTIAQIGDALSPSGQPDPEIITPISKVPELLAKTKTLEQSSNIINKTANNKSIGSIAKERLQENTNLKAEQEKQNEDRPKGDVNIQSNQMIHTEGKNQLPKIETVRPKAIAALGVETHLPRWRRGIG